MTSDFMISDDEVNKLMYLIQKLEGNKILAVKLKDNGAYNKIVSLKLNINSYISFFQKRVKNG
jgi:hypothetical protein